MDPAVPGAGNGQVPELSAHGVTGATELRYLYEESLELDPALVQSYVKRASMHLEQSKFCS